MRRLNPFQEIRQLKKYNVQAGAAPMSNSFQITSSFGKGDETRCGCFNVPTFYLFQY